MGSRMMRRWLVMPLKDKLPINERLDAVEFFIKNETLAENLRQQIRLIGDLERIISKVATGRINPREVVQLKRALQALEPIKTICTTSGISSLQLMADQLNPCSIMTEKIGKELNPDPPVAVKKEM